MKKTVQEILASVAKGEVTAQEAEALLTPSKERLVISDKGAIKVRTIRKRFGGLALYPNEMVVLLGMKDEIEAFMLANKDILDQSKGIEP